MRPTFRLYANDIEIRCVCHFSFSQPSHRMRKDKYLQCIYDTQKNTIEWYE